MARLIVYVLTAFGVAVLLLWTDSGIGGPSVAAKIKRIRALSPDAARSVIVHDKHGRHELANLTDQGAVRSFLVALKTAMPYEPNHPRYLRSMQVWLRGDIDVELECFFEDRRPGAVICRFEDRLGLSDIPQGGHVICPALRPWFDKYVPRNGPAAEHPPPRPVAIGGTGSL